MTLSKAPYSEVLADLISSVMAAQHDVAEALAKNVRIEEISNSQINRHFAWLALVYPEGINRHLFDPAEGSFPIRTRSLRWRSRLPGELRARLLARQPLPLDIDRDPAVHIFLRDNHLKRLLQDGPTRFSRIIKSAFSDALQAEKDGGEPHNEEPSDGGVYLKSPLSIVLDFLTIPEMPGSRAYAWLSVRNFIFEVFKIFPRGLADLPSHLTFSVADVEATHSAIWTSMRPRFWSTGQDPFSAEGRSPHVGVVRHCLAARGVLWFWFKDAEARRQYLTRADLRGEKGAYTFRRSKFLDHLPDLGEIVNELWGLPIPIRGADTVFRGGLKFSSRRGLVFGVHGGPGTGKTSLALALGAFLAPFGIHTLFLTAEESEEDLRDKAEGLVPDEIRRLSFFPRKLKWLTIQPIPLQDALESDEDPLSALTDALNFLKDALDVPTQDGNALASPKPCRAIVVLDGIHDLLMNDPHSEDGEINLPRRLREFIGSCRDLRALVLLTTGEDWAGDKALDYLVDVAVRLSHDDIDEYGKKPNRRLLLTKARHQLCAVGTHGVQISGARGVRLSPQINYQLDRSAIWRNRLPETTFTRNVLRNVLRESDFHRFAALMRENKRVAGISFRETNAGVTLYRGSNIFLHGQGSGSKAALALKIAVAPDFDQRGSQTDRAHKALIVSFLYPQQYYDELLERLLRLRSLETPGASAATIDVVHLYPGHYRPDQLFNRIEWMLEAAELHGAPYTAVILDGMHNVFLQFPEIDKYPLFWPQLYAALRARPLTIITTHTTFLLQGAPYVQFRVDDGRSEPLRHALVQKTDFRFEVEPYSAVRAGAGGGGGEAMGGRKVDASNIFTVRTIGAVHQPIPSGTIFWSRDNLVLFEPDHQDPQRLL